MLWKKGFTLIEAMVVVAIIAILTVVAVPSFVRLMNASSIAGATNELVGDLALARNQASNSGGATVCPSADGINCSNGTDWSGGRIVLSGTKVLRKTDSATGFTITSAGFSPANSVSYQSDGSLTSAVSGTLTVCKSGSIGRIVRVLNTGGVRLDATASVCP